jgi:hypothetical protein
MIDAGKWRRPSAVLSAGPDNTLRTSIIHRVGETTPYAILKGLETERKASVRQALILALGEFSSQQVHHLDLRGLTSRLVTNTRATPIRACIALSTGLCAAVTATF